MGSSSPFFIRERFMIKVRMKKISKLAKLPERMTDHAAGYDIYSANVQDIDIAPGKLVMVPTGIAISLPNGYEAQIRPRSGLAYKHQIGVLNSPGTIDADYRGEVRILLYNFSDVEFVITPNMRIAQMVVAKHEVIDFEICDELDETIREAGGFGHTKH